MRLLRSLSGTGEEEPVRDALSVKDKEEIRNGHFHSLWHISYFIICLLFIHSPIYFICQLQPLSRPPCPVPPLPIPSSSVSIQVNAHLL